MDNVLKEEYSNKNLCEKCSLLFKEHEEIIRKFEKFGKEKWKLKSSYTTKYAVGGEIMHRGYLCPSLTDDFITGNVRRGRIVPDYTDKCDYRYVFDENEQLIYIEKYTELKKCRVSEYIWYEKNIQYGILVTESNSGDRITNVTRCIYNKHNKIEKYEYSSVSTNDLDENYIDRILIEENYYDNNTPSKTFTYTCFVVLEEDVELLERYKKDDYFCIVNNQYFCIVDKRIITLIRNEKNKVEKIHVISIDDTKVKSQGIITIPKYKQRIV